MFQGIRLVSLLLVIPIAFSGCAHKAKRSSYHPQQLRHVTHETADFSETKQNVTIHVKRLNKEENQYYFGGYALKTFQPIQITVYNQGAQAVVIAPENVELKQVPLDRVQSVMTGARYQHVGLLTCISALVTSIVLGPPIATVWLLAMHPMYHAGWWAGLSSFFGLVGLASINPIAWWAFWSDGGEDRRALKQLVRSDVESKMLAQDLVIPPYETKSVLAFAKKQKSYSPFSITLFHFNDSRKTVEFTVSLPKISSH